MLLLKIIKNPISLGYNYRYPLTEIPDFLKLTKFKENIEKKHLLIFLQSNDVSTFDKVEKINDYYNNNLLKPGKLFNGGLLKDWDFDF